MAEDKVHKYEAAGRLPRIGILSAEPDLADFMADMQTDSDQSNFSFALFDSEEKITSALRDRELDGWLLRNFKSDWEAFSQVASNPIAVRVPFVVVADSGAWPFKNWPETMKPAFVFDPDTPLGVLLNSIQKTALAHFLQRTLAKREEELEQARITDPMTGLLNHSHFETLLDREFLRAKRYGSNLSLVVLDIDNFKMINDTYGHLTGDRVLLEMARLIRISTRSIDIVARWGGDEFAMILPETKQEGSFFLAEKIRDLAFTNIVLPENENYRITVSSGIATFPKEGIESGIQLFELADTAHYRAKFSGKNRTVVYEIPILTKTVTLAEQRKSVLISVKETDELSRVSAILERHGYFVLQTTDGIQALQRIIAERPDIAILEHDLSSLTGLQIASRLKSKKKSSFHPILLIVPPEEMGLLAELHRAGADDVIQTGFKESELICRVGSLLQLKAKHDRLQETERKFIQTQLAEHRLKQQVGEISNLVCIEMKNMLANFMGKVTEAVGQSGLSGETAFRMRKSLDVGGSLLMAMHNLEDVLARNEPVNIFPEPLEITDFLENVVQSWRNSIIATNIRLDLQIIDPDTVIQGDSHILTRIIHAVINYRISKDPTTNSVHLVAGPSHDERDIILAMGIGPDFVTPTAMRKPASAVIPDQNDLRLDTVTGLGMNFAQTVINQLGGDIWLEKNANAKSMILCSIPRHKQAGKRQLALSDR